MPVKGVENWWVHKILITQKIPDSKLKETTKDTKNIQNNKSILIQYCKKTRNFEEIKHIKAEHTHKRDIKARKNKNSNWKISTNVKNGP